MIRPDKSVMYSHLKYSNPNPSFIFSRYCFTCSSILLMFVRPSLPNKQFFSIAILWFPIVIQSIFFYFLWYYPWFNLLCLQVYFLAFIFMSLFAFSSVLLTKWTNWKKNVTVKKVKLTSQEVTAWWPGVISVFLSLFLFSPLHFSLSHIVFASFFMHF